jgi:hypothetical protein
MISIQLLQQAAAAWSVLREFKVCEVAAAA